jgi:hypothetical protein
VIARVQTAAGVATIDIEEELVLGVDPYDSVEPADPVPVSLPRVLASAASGSTVVCLVDARPPVLVSHDAGRTWRESGRGLPAGRAIAISPEDPDLLLYAAVDRLFLSRDGGRFWRSLAVELEEIEAVALDAD